MSLALGARVGSYAILGLVGRGGMGEVYRAHDSKLHRDVALKILPPAFAQDPDRLLRFQREAYVLASLNHPNIAHIHGFEEDDQHRALVLELVEGPTLADLIAGQRPSETDALAIARQIADALGAAHDAGVVHRDLKPANIKVRPDGTVKVLDFGLAKAVEAASGDVSASPTITSPAMTERGVILGTAAYMSPEQARGKPVDKRADIWAFGVVVYELLTGRRPFLGEDVSDTLAAVLRAEPDLSNVPPRLRRLLGKCLEKDPRRRLHDIHDVWELVDDRPPIAAAATPLPAVRRMWWVVPVAAALTIGAFFAGRARPDDDPRVVNEPRRFRIEMPASVRIPETGPQIALSPNGQVLVFRAEAADGIPRLYRRDLNALEATPIRGTERVRYQGPPFFSHDGQWLAFMAGNQLMKVNLGGGQPEVVTALPRGSKPYARQGSNWGGGSWAADGSMALALFEGGLVRVPPAGGDPVVVAETEDDFVWFQQPQWLADGKAVLVSALRPGGAGELRIIDVATGGARSLLRAWAGWVVPSGHLAFLRESTLWAARFDAARLEIVGEAKPVESGVRFNARSIDTASVAFGGDGSLAYVEGDVVPPVTDTLVWVDHAGRETAVAGVPPRFLGEVRLSPKDDRVAVTAIEGGVPSLSLWDFRGLTRLTSHQDVNRAPVWSADGRHLFYLVQREGKHLTYWQPWDRPGEARILTTGSAQSAVPVAVSPDGTRLVTQSATLPPVTSVYRLPPGGEGPLTFEHSFPGSFASVSRDGRWIAYISQESGSNELWARPFPDVSVRGKQVSVSGAIRALWGRSTGQLFFVGGTQPNMFMMAVDVGPTATLGDARTPRQLFSMAPYPLRVYRNFDISEDDRRFLIVKNLPEKPATRRPAIVVVQHWQDQLARILAEP